ncbi:MAG: hypothetical protein HY518_05815 [Candidatus Aenigmarchaeota archaeon]|nr:hypothetical protein [Candidatus Aenigmarchaeota archaeon]
MSPRVVDHLTMRIPNTSANACEGCGNYFTLVGVETDFTGIKRGIRDVYRNLGFEFKGSRNCSDGSYLKFSRGKESITVLASYNPDTGLLVLAEE